MESSTSSRVLRITHGSIFLYAACFFIQATAFPFLTKSLNVDTVMFGWLQTTFALLQLIGGPLFGRFGDVFGGRAAVCLGFTSACISYGLSSLAVSVNMLFVAQIPILFMHAMQAGQMVITDISSSEGRADALGKLGLSYGVGMVVGPIIGGKLTAVFNERMSLMVASAVCGSACLLNWALIPRWIKKTAQKPQGGESMLQWARWRSILSQPGVFQILAIKIIAGLPLGAFQAMSALIFLDRFQLEPQQNGYVLSYIGFVVMFMQGIGVGVLAKHFSEEKLVKWANFMLIWSWLSFAFITSIWQFCVVMVPLGLGFAAQNIVITSVLTKSVSDSDTGAMLGLSMAVNSMVRIFTPTMGAYMLHNLGFPAFGMFGCAISVCMSVFLFMFWTLPDKHKFEKS